MILMYFESLNMIFQKGICRAYNTTIPLEPGNSNLIIIFDWPESQIEEIAYISCPCGYMNIDTGEELQPSRLCRRDPTNGAQWEMAYLAPCNFTDGVQSICQIATVRLIISVFIACNISFCALLSDFKCVLFSL